MYPENEGLITRKRIAVVIILFFALAVVWFVYNITRSGWLEVSASDKTPAGTSVSIQVTREEGGEPTRVELKAGETKKISLKKGAVRVDASDGRLKSVDIVHIRSLSTTKLVAPEGEQRAIRKLGSGAQTCPTVVDGQLYSHECHGEGLAYKHHKLDSNVLDPKEPLFKNTLISGTYPLQNSFMALLSGEEDSAFHELHFANLASGALEKMTLASEVETLLKNERPSIIASSDPGKPYFILSFARGNVAYLFKQINDPSPVKLELPKNAELSDNFGITTFEFYGDQIVTYAGRTDVRDIDEAPSGQAEPDYANNIYEFDLSGKVVKTIDLPKTLRALGLYKLTDSFYAMEQINGLEFYHLNGDELRKVYRLEDATKPLVMGDKVYIEATGTLYTFQDKGEGLFTLHSVFSSEVVSVSELFRGPNGLIFTATAARLDPEPLDVYELLTTPQTIPPLEEVVDFGELQSIITGYDYDDEKIIFSLSSTGSGASYETLRSRMEAKLKELGMDVGGRRVELYPLN